MNAIRGDSIGIRLRRSQPIDETSMQVRYGQHVDNNAIATLGWERMTSGPGAAYARKVVWAKDCDPKDADFSAVYVFDARDDAQDLPQIRRWLAFFGSGKPPLTAVIAPKRGEDMSDAEFKAFEDAAESLWAYPLSRPKDDSYLLAYVTRILPPRAKSAK